MSPSTTTVDHAIDAQRHLQGELAWLAVHLGAVLDTWRKRGHEPGADPAMPLDEAAALVEELSGDGAWPAPSSDPLVHRARPDGHAAGVDVRLPLSHARRAFSLHQAEYAALLLTLAVEIDARFARLVAFLNDHLDRPRPTLGLAQALARQIGETLPLVGLVHRPWVRDGLIDIDGDGPLPTRTLRLDHGMVARCAGQEPETPPWLKGTPPDLHALSRLVLNEDQRRILAGWVAHLRAHRRVPPVVLVGAPGSGRATIAQAVCGAAGWPLVAIAADDQPAPRLTVARRECRWHGAALLVTGIQGEWPTLWTSLPDTPCLLSVLPDQRDAAMTSAGEAPLLITCGGHDSVQRAAVWRHLLPPGETLEDTQITALAERHRLDPGAIARAIGRARARQGLESSRPLSPAVLAAAARDHAQEALGTLAQRLAQPYQRSDLVVPATVDRELDLAIAWLRHGGRVFGAWGLGRRVAMGRGLTALFSGPPGTGKTMAAQVLARELELDCYRVDLAQVVNKYVGETEKNLERLFTLAESSGAVLFFDEADALFGKRSEVRDARDRYANLEVGYLLQRMEAFDGVTILATNRVTDLDEAFLRRFQVVAEFPRPGVAERQRIWASLLATGIPCAPDVDAQTLAMAFELSGGEIKNCVTAAAVMAAAAAHDLTQDLCRAAVKRELAKNGRIFTG